MNELIIARSNFPYLKNGKIYFNHASTGPISSRVRTKLNEIITEKSETDLDNFQKFLQASSETKTLLGELINCKADRIAFVDNTTNGLNILAQGLKWKRGDRIILNDLEFPANVYPFLNLGQEGVIIDFVKSRAGVVSSEDIIEAIKPETKLISISQVQFLTGYRVDLEKLGKVCKEKDIILSVDAIQGLGAVRLNVESQNISFLSSGSQKWLLGLQGLGFIYVSGELQEKISPKYVGWLSVENAWNLLDYDLKLRSSAESFQCGTLNTLGIFALNESLKFFKEFGPDFIENRVLENSAYLIQKLEDIGVEPVLKNMPPDRLAGIVSFKHQDSKKIFSLLEKNDIICAVREGMIRLSPHFYNIKEESDKVIQILSELPK